MAKRNTPAADDIIAGNLVITLRESLQEIYEKLADACEQLDSIETLLNNTARRRLREVKDARQG